MAGGEVSRSLISSGNYGPRGKYGYGGPNTQYKSFVLDIYWKVLLYCGILKGKKKLS